MQRLITLVTIAFVALFAGDSRAQVAYPDTGHTSVATTRAVDQSYTDPSIVGGTNLGSDTTGSTLRGVRGNYATVLGGDQCIARADYGTSGGLGAVAGAEGALSIGYYTDAEGAYAAAFGNQTGAMADNSAAFGYLSSARGVAAFVEGQQSQATAFTAHAEGYDTLASGSTSHAEGSLTWASGYGAHAENVGTYATGAYTHAEGEDGTAEGMDSHVEGLACWARGHACHADGLTTQCDGFASSSHGIASDALRDSQWAYASGNFNDSSDDVLPLTHVGEAQTSLMVLRGTTPGSSAGESTFLHYGRVGVSTVYLEAGKAYAVHVRAVLGGVVSGSRAAVVCTEDAMVRVDGGAVSVVNGVAVCMGDSAASTWSIALAADATYPYFDVAATTGSTTSAIRAVARLEFTEVVF